MTDTPTDTVIEVTQADRDHAEAIVARAVLGVAIEDARFIADGVFDFDRAVECVADDRARYRQAMLSSAPTRPVADAGWRDAVKVFGKRADFLRSQAEASFYPAACSEYRGKEAAFREAADMLAALASAQPQPQPETDGWIVTSGDGLRFRTWKTGWSAWTDKRDEATRYACREDAEAVHGEDDDAWRIEPYGAQPQPEGVREEAPWQGERPEKLCEAIAQYWAEWEEDRAGRGVYLPDELAEDAGDFATGLYDHLAALTPRPSTGEGERL